MKLPEADFSGDHEPFIGRKELEIGRKELERASDAARDANCRTLGSRCVEVCCFRSNRVLRLLISGPRG